MVIIIIFKFIIKQFDIINVFYNFYINKEFYCYPPVGFKMFGWILLLQKVLYGLK